MASSEKIFRLAKKSLKRVLTTSDLFSVGYGDVGSSIYYTLGATALFALGATPLALLIAGLVFVCTALTYAEMSSTFPEPGGAATFSRHAFNDLISFIAGWGLLLDYILTLAISAFTIPPYLSQLFAMAGFPGSDSDLVHTVSTIAIIGLLFFVNFFGVKYSGKFSFWLAIFTLVTQAGIVLLGGLLILNLPYIFDHMRIGVPGVDWSPDWWEFAKGCAIAMVAYTGIEAIAQLSAETKNPGKSVPRSIKWTVAVVLFLYVGISAVGLSVLSPQELGTTYIENPVAGIAMNFPVGGAILGPWVGLIAAVILLICANAGLIGCSRLTFSMGEFYQVPHVLFKLHHRFRTPYVSLAIFSILAVGVIILSRNRMLFLVDLYNFGAQIAFCSAHISLIVLRCKRPDLHRPYKVPLNIPIGKNRSIPLSAVLGAIATFSVWLIVVITKPEGRVLGLSWMAIGLAMYLYYRKRKQIAPMGQLEVEAIKIKAYKPMHIKHILVAARSIGGTEALQTAFQLAKLHGAKATAAFILEIPHSLPIDAKLEKREQVGEEALKRAEAVAREYHVTVDLQLIRSRSFEKALGQLFEGDGYDLIVIGVEKDEIKNRSPFALEAEKLFKVSPGRILLCRM